MEEPTQVWRFKSFCRKRTVQSYDVKPDAPNCPNVPACENCRRVRSRTCGSSDERLRCRKIPPIEEPSLASIKDSVSANCYSCCCTLKEFFKEAFKAISGDPKNRVCDILCEMTDLLLALANDCVFFLRKLCKCFLENMTLKS